MEHHLNAIIALLAVMPIAEKIDSINKIKTAIHAVSPFIDEPVDCVLWVKSENIRANDYNPNSVAPPEMELLRLSIESDGFTQPIVAFKTETDHEVIDGFHRHRVGKEYPEITDRIHGYLPVVVINETRHDKTDRIAATIRHNRARGKHRIDAMSDIVLELARRNWNDTKIGKELGMEPDEVLRLKQISGLAEMFENDEFSEAWEA